MPSIHRFVPPAVIALILVLLPVSLRAENMKHSFELGAGFNFLHFDGQTNLASTIGPSLLVGFNITKRHGVELGGTFLTATPSEGASFPVDVGVLRAGYTYNAYPRKKIVSFFRVGVGRFAISPERDPDAGSSLQDNDARLMVYTGGGVRFFLKDWMGIRVSATFDAIDNGNGAGHLATQASGELGVIFLLGGVEAEAEPAETPAADQTPPAPETPKN